MTDRDQRQPSDLRPAHTEWGEDRGDYKRDTYWLIVSVLLTLFYLSRQKVHMWTHCSSNNVRTKNRW